MARYFYGCDEITEGWERYFELCNALELDLGTFDETPKIETLNSWRVDSPRNFCFTVHLRPEIGRYLARADGDIPDDLSEYPQMVREAWDVTSDRADALAARALVLRTSAEFTPGKASRQRLASLTRALEDETDAAIVWEPSGLWTVDQRCEVAEELGIAPVYDPFVAHREGHEFTHGDVGFAITERPGMRRQYDTFDFENLIRWTERYDRVFVMLRGRHKWAHAQKMSAAVRKTGR